MTIDKAIGEGTQLAKVGLNRLTPDELAFVKLGIEALKKYQLMREHSGFDWDYHLPGETTD